MKPTRFDRRRFTFSTLGCPEDDLGHSMERAKRHGFPCLELRALGGRLDLPAYFAERYGRPAALRRELDAAGSGVCVLDTSFKLIGSGPRDREELLDFIPWAEGLDVPWLRVFDGGSLKDPLTEAAVREAAETLQWWNAKRERAGWNCDFIVETHSSLLRAADCDVLHKACGGGLNLLWDTHHTWFHGGETPGETWRGIAPLVRHLHIKDSVTDESVEPGYRNVPCGEGGFPFDRLLEALQEPFFSGFVSFEWEKKWHPELDDLNTALARMEANGFWSPDGRGEAR